MVRVLLIVLAIIPNNVSHWVF